MKKKVRYLEVSYRNGRILAAYLHLTSKWDSTSARTERREAGLIVDYGADGRALGIEITAPTIVNLNILNRVLADLGEDSAGPEEIAPLVAVQPTVAV